MRLARQPGPPPPPPPLLASRLLLFLVAKVRNSLQRMRVLEGQIQLINSVQKIKYASDRRAALPIEPQLFCGPLHWMQTQVGDHRHGRTARLWSS